MTTLYQQSVSSFSDFGVSSISPSLSVERSPSFFHNVLDSPHHPPSMSSSRSDRAKDSFYGHKDVATTTSDFILEKFGCNIEGDSSDECFCYGLDLPRFIARCIHLGQIPYNYVWGTVLLLMRYHKSLEQGWDKEVDGSTPLLGHSMFLCALYFTTQEHFDPTGRALHYGDPSIWIEMTGFSLDETVLYQYFWDFFANLSGDVSVDSHLDASPKPNPDAFESATRPISSKEIADLPKPPKMGR
ncbi:hypothetical protein CVT24_006884 [Panaeolus cyanescens]|uniref:Uncharacterized protein n=1 Tax=Panaeolus cyanescens TaxID=181874 RepID=A0A409YWU6_9AGAR|nr:hypothetical protein CVT24_006884 [Panaeolus cyanescens]